jgi:hypothetical protein
VYQQDSVTPEFLNQHGQACCQPRITREITIVQYREQRFFLSRSRGHELSVEPPDRGTLFFK